MSTSQPIRDTQDLTALREFYLKDEPNMRNYVLICLGVNSALRISDLLELKWKDVYNFKDENFKKHLITYEKKTGKETWIAINENARNCLQEYMKFLKKISGEDYIFEGKNKDLINLKQMDRDECIEAFNEYSKNNGTIY